MLPVFLELMFIQNGLSLAYKLAGMQDWQLSPKKPARTDLTHYFVAHYDVAATMSDSTHKSCSGEPLVSSFFPKKVIGYIPI